MDFTARGQQPASAPSNASPAESAAPGHRRSSSRESASGRWIKLTSVILLFSITILLVALTLLTYVNRNNNNETGYLNSGNFQAIDINVGGTNGDQIYFGQIQKITSNYVVVDNVYYIPSSTSTASVTLQPLVCQIDSPYNQMVINRDSVNWWENLQASSQVVKTITNYEKQNPNGPTCPTSSTTPAATSSTSSTTK